MANTKKKVDEATAVEEVVPEENAIKAPKAKKASTSTKKVVTATQESPVKEKRVFNATDVILCRSVTYGELMLPSAKNADMLYSWADFGDIQEIEYQDLRALRSKRSAYIYGPYFVIEDEDLVAEWSDLKDLYKTVSALNLDQVFDLPVAQLAKKLQAMPKVYRETIKNAASARILSGELDSISKIKVIDEVLGTDLKFYIQ